MIKLFLFLFVIALPSMKPAGAETVPLGSFAGDDPTGFVRDLTINVGGFSTVLPASEIAGWISSKSDLDYNPSYRSEIENDDFCKYKKSVVCALTFSDKNDNHIQLATHLYVDKDAVSRYVDDIARQADRDPVDAKLTITDGRASVFSLSQKGIKLDKTKSVTVLIDYLSKRQPDPSVSLPYVEKNPDISTDSIDNLGITSLIGEGHSDFRGSPRNRVFNIQVATERFNGVLIKPGEEFSFVKILGPVDAEHGYLPELVIKQNKTEPEFGGGICQVSTTAFRAAIYSGLKITERVNHAYPVSYYDPQGMDATVYIPQPDLRFINDTPGYILIQTKISGTQLIFQFYGTDDGRKVNVIGPKILERNPDGSMKATFTQQVFGTDGKLIRADVFNSNYDSPSKYPHPDQTSSKKSR